ncbi:MAG: ATP-binding protein, partial [Alphaproteobacteria bacterium]|nr:ATP-binding protein [Alphaproteobacteria bacterium]
MKSRRTFSSPLRIGIIGIGVLLAVIYLVFTGWFRQQLEEDAIEFRENLLWAVFQVQKELITSLRISENVISGANIPADELLLNYEILVSRINLVRQGDGFEDLRQINDFVLTLDKLENSVAAIDQALENVGNDPVSIATILLQHLQPYEKLLQRNSLAAINFTTVRNTTRNADIVKKLNWLQVLFVSNLVLIGGTIFFAFRQTLRAYRKDFEVEEQAMARRFVEETAERSKLEALGSLAGGVAHEINTPAQFVTTNLEFLSDACRDLLAEDSSKMTADDLEYFREEIPLAITQSQEGMARIRDIVKAIKHFAHPEQGKQSLISIEEEVKNAIILTGNRTKSNVQVETNIEEKLPPVFGYPNELNQVLINLIMNAAYAFTKRADVSASPESSNKVDKITITATLNGKDIVIVVRDNGPGIPHDIASRIFDPFFTTKPVGEGSGQG